MPDLYPFIDDIDADRQAMVVKRLQDRDQMPKFAEIRENYFDKIGLPPTGRILELGCGTGAVLPCDRVMGAKWLEILKRIAPQWPG
jgi:hypothetical protein